MHASVSAVRTHIPALCLSLLLLSGCGGGGGGGSDDDAAAPATAADAALSAVLGRYVIACEGGIDLPYRPGSYSTQGTLTITADSDPRLAAVSIHVQEYQSASADPSGSRCDPAALVFDLTVNGYIRDMGTRKAIRMADNSTVSAKVVEFTYTGLKLSKGSFSGQFPTPNMTTQVAYLLENGNLRLTSGPREADGIAAKFHRRVGVKQ